MDGSGLEFDERRMRSVARHRIRTRVIKILYWMPRGCRMEHLGILGDTGAITIKRNCSHCTRETQGTRWVRLINSCTPFPADAMHA